MLDSVAIKELLPVARAVSFSSRGLELDHYALARIEMKPPVSGVVTVLQSKTPGFVKRPSPEAEAVGRELDALKLGLLSGGPFMNLLNVDRAPLTGLIRDGRTFGELRSSIANAERAYRVLEEEYPWESLGPEVYMVGAWREYAWAGFQEIVHSGRAVDRVEFRNFITVTILADFDAIMDRMEAKVQAKVRKMERLATVRMVAMVGMGLALGATLGAVPALLAKKGLAQLNSHQQAELGQSLEDLAGAFPSSMEPFRQEILRTIGSLEARAPKPAPGPARNVDPAYAPTPAQARSEAPALDLHPAVAVPTRDTAPSFVEKFVDWLRNIWRGGNR